MGLREWHTRCWSSSVRRAIRNTELRLRRLSTTSAIGLMPKPPIGQTSARRQDGGTGTPHGPSRRRGAMGPRGSRYRGTGLRCGIWRRTRLPPYDGCPGMVFFTAKNYNSGCSHPSRRCRMPLRDPTRRGPTPVLPFVIGLLPTRILAAPRESMQLFTIEYDEENTSKPKANRGQDS